MGRRLAGSIVLVVGGAVAGFLAAALPLAGQAPAAGSSSYRAARSPHADGTPDLSGIWQAMTSANFDIEVHGASQGPLPSAGAIVSVPPGHGIVVGGAIPY